MKNTATSEVKNHRNVEQSKLLQRIGSTIIYSVSVHYSRMRDETIKGIKEIKAAERRLGTLTEHLTPGYVKRGKK